MDGEFAVAQPFSGGHASGADGEHLVEQPLRGSVERLAAVEDAADEQAAKEAAERHDQGEPLA